MSKIKNYIQDKLDHQIPTQSDSANNKPVEPFERTFIEPDRKSKVKSKSPVRGSVGRSESGTIN